jgi:hypothetical protein
MKPFARAILLCTLVILYNETLAQGYQPYWEMPAYQLSSADSLFLEDLQRDTFNWFWQKAHSSTGLTPDRSRDASTDNSLISVAAVGFGLTAYGIGSERGYVTREQAANRVDHVLNGLLQGKMGRETQGNIGYRGWYYHFINANTLSRDWNSELSSIDTALLLMGVVFVRNYFDDLDSSREIDIRAKADSILERVQWPFMRNPNNNGVSAGWFPESGFIDWEYQGYNEAMLLYILGLGAETNPLPTLSWTFWKFGYRTGTTPHFGANFVRFGPLFGHHYPQAWIDFAGLRSPELTNPALGEPYDYFENTRRATYANRAYCAANPLSWPNYGENEWGLTACDGPPGFGFNGYFARAASDLNPLDDGTIAPTAAGASLVYAPEIVLPALQHMKATHGSQLYGTYGFRDAYNDSVNWYDTDYIGIDQGPILMAIENFRSRMVWLTMRKDPIIQRGLQRAGFTGGWLDSLTVAVEEPLPIVQIFVLNQNYPNPFNAETQITFELHEAGKVRVEIFNLLGEKITTLIDEFRPSGAHALRFSAANLPSGIYGYRLTAGTNSQSRSMILIR